MALDEVFGQHVPDYPGGVLARANRTRNYDELHAFLRQTGSAASADRDKPPKEDPEQTATAEARAPIVSVPPVSADVVPSPKRRRGVRQAIAAAAILSLVVGVTTAWYYIRPVTLDGEVTCRSGAPVTGVWVTYVDELNWGDFSETPARIGNSDRYAFTARTPVLNAWRVRVGCGGTRDVWAARPRSGPFVKNPVRLLCDDSDAEPLPGSCVEVP